MNNIDKQRIFLLGRFHLGTDESRINSNILKSLQSCYDVVAVDYDNVVFRKVIKILQCDIVFICSNSEINIGVVRLAHFFKKKIIYLIHSEKSYEENIRITTDRALEKSIDILLSKADKVICTSLKMKALLSEKKLLDAEKITVVYDYVDFEKLTVGVSICGLREEQVLSTKDGTKMKDNSQVARAIFDLDPKMKYYVIGQSEVNREIIEKFPNVVLYDHLSKKEIYKFMQTSTIYLENNSYHVFGIDALEALYLGCDLLLSYDVEALELFSNLTNDDILYNTRDIEEIERKIQHLKEKGNHERLRQGINWDDVTSKSQIKKIQQIISEG